MYQVEQQKLLMYVFYLAVTVKRVQHAMELHKYGSGLHVHQKRGDNLIIKCFTVPYPAQ